MKPAVHEQCFFLLHGAGANGKTTLANTLRYVLGDYALNTGFSTIEQYARTSISNDVAALVNCRFVTAAETNDGMRLNEARIKMLTGGDRSRRDSSMASRFTFVPTLKLWLLANHKPVIKDDSYGFRRRVRLIPFERTFAPDPALADELKNEAPGILRWCIDGALAWRRQGLDPPSVVLASTQAYEDESDPLHDFLDEAVKPAAGSVVRAADLYVIYARWATAHGLTERERLSNKAFGERMQQAYVRARTLAADITKGLPAPNGRTSNDGSTVQNARGHEPRPSMPGRCDRSNPNK